MLVAGITLGMTDEDPLRHSGAIPVRIDFKTPDLADRHYHGTNDVSVQIDRGVAGYAYPLPRRSPEAFLSDAFAGWGESADTTSSPLYTHVADSLGNARSAG